MPDPVRSPLLANVLLLTAAAVVRAGSFYVGIAEFTTPNHRVAALYGPIDGLQPAAEYVAKYATISKIIKLHGRIYATFERDTTL